MKYFFSVCLLAIAVTVASAQIPTPCLNQMPNAAASTGQGLVSRPGIHRSSQLSPMVSYSRYAIGNKVRVGPSMIFQVSLFRGKSEAIDILAGLMLRYRNTSESVDLGGYTPLGLRSYFTMKPAAGGIRLGAGFFGLDYTFYLADGDIRPYLGIGAMVLSWPYRNGFAGTIAPDVKGGVSVEVTSGFSGFVEMKHVLGFPFVAGVDSPPLRGFTGFAFGFAFASRWN